MRTYAMVAGLLLAASAALAQPVQPTITSITPNTVPVTGGTLVIIKGTGFTRNCIICSPPFADPDVFFGGTPATISHFIDSMTIEAVTPPLMPTTMRVTVRQHDTTGVTVENALTVTGEALEAFEPLLFPIFMPPVRGAFGSEFHTLIRAWNRGPSPPINVYGIDTICYLFSPVLDPVTDPTVLQSSGSEIEFLTGCSTSTGRILYVPKEQARFLSLNERVSDVSRSATNHGTEIPVVRRSGFTDQGIALLNVPANANFRNTLRIYALRPTQVIVTIGNNSQMVTLESGRDIFEPAFATFTDFPQTTEAEPIRVVITYPLFPGGLIPVPSVPPPIWAFITVTNNETQQITTITPN